MNNRFIFAVIALVALVAIGEALPARKRMVYYQQPMAAQFYGAPKRMMYVQYVQPSHNTHARSTQATSALVAGETVATGTYIEDCNHEESDVATAGSNVQHGEDVLSAAGVHSAHSVAEAYPDDTNAASAPPPSRAQTVEVDETVIADVPVAEQPTETEIPTENQTPIEVQTPVESDNEAKVPRDYNFESEEPAVELPAPAPIAPVASAAIVPPARRYLPSKKKVYVELDETEEAEEPETANAVAVAEDEENEEEDDEETDVAAVKPVVPQKPNARRPIAKKPAKPVKPVKASADCAGCAKAGSAGSGSSKPQLPAGTFFPIDFGGTAGGAIAIANSFSTGEGGSATSHAIAYGSPDAVRARAKPSKLH